MSNVDKIAKDLAGIIKSSDSKATAPYDTKATVKKVENGTAWVQIPGGVDETPVQMTLNAKEGDTVQVRVSGGRAWITGNGTNPPTDDTRANQAYNIADSAIVDAQRARNAADNAEASAADAKATADAVHGIAVEAKQDAAEAETAAGQAQISAENASEYAARALGNLSTVQSVTETLNWITQHGTMTNTQDLTPPETALDPTHVYFVRDNNGDYEVGNYRYSVVTEPDVADISTYYVLSIDESLNNYVGTHLAVTSEGLWILPEGMSTSSHKILIATGGQGHTYETAGTYIIDSAGDAVAKFTTSGAVIGIDKNGNSYSVIGADGMQIYQKQNSNSEQIVNLGYGLGNKADGTQAYAPYATLGCRKANVAVGNYSVAEGIDIEASGYSSHAEGYQTTASKSFSHAEGFKTEANGRESHAEGYYTEASGEDSHAEGNQTVASGSTSHAEGEHTIASGRASHAEGSYTEASGIESHAQNRGTIAAKSNQTAIGRYNIEDKETTSAKQKALIIGNGTSNNYRSNALTVDWQGNVDIASGAKYKINGTELSASDVSALPISGGTITGDLTVNGDTTLEGVTYLGLDVDSSASKTTPATSGEDKELFNAIRDLGWYDDVIS